MHLLPRWELKHEKFDEFPKSHRFCRENSPGITSQKLLLSGTNQLFHLDREETVRVNPKVAPQRPTVNKLRFLLHDGLSICWKNTLFASVLSVADKISWNRTITLTLMKIQQMLNLWYFIALFYLGKESSFAKILMKKKTFILLLDSLNACVQLFVPVFSSHCCLFILLIG